MLILFQSMMLCFIICLDCSINGYYYFYTTCYNQLLYLIHYQCIMANKTIIYDITNILTCMAILFTNLVNSCIVYCYFNMCKTITINIAKVLILFIDIYLISNVVCIIRTRFLLYWFFNNYTCMLKLKDVLCIIFCISINATHCNRMYALVLCSTVHILLFMNHLVYLNYQIINCGCYYNVLLIYVLCIML